MHVSRSGQVKTAVNVRSAPEPNGVPCHDTLPPFGHDAGGVPFIWRAKKVNGMFAPREASVVKHVTVMVVGTLSGTAAGLQVMPHCLMIGPGGGGGHGLQTGGRGREARR